MSNSMKLSHALWGHPRWAGMVERSDTMWTTGEGIIVIVYIIVPNWKKEKKKKHAFCNRKAKTYSGMSITWKTTQKQKGVKWGLKVLCFVT